jgi:UDP-N-acetyl-D-glucosamine dehydrogenase
MTQHSSQHVLVVGQGYVGLPIAMRAWEVGHSVVGFDLDTDRVGQLRDGQSYIEDVPSSQVAEAVASGRFEPVAEISELKPFDIAVVSVPTPLADGAPDMHYLRDAAAIVGRLVRPGCCVILESTTYPGTTEELFGPILAQVSGLAVGRDFQLGYSPERIDPGNATYNLVNTPKVVSGVDQASADRIEAFFSTIVDQPVLVSSVKVAELTKLLENTFRHVNIALINELAMFARDLDIDVWEAIDAASTKPFGYMRFTPGPGVGGHCLPVDPTYLSWRVRQRLGHSFRFVELANDVNDHMPDYVVTRIISLLNGRGMAVKDRRILLLGMSYKRNTGDARESPSATIAQTLVALGADVRAADPHVDPNHMPDGVDLVALNDEVLAAADLVVSLVDHDEFDPAQIVANSKLVFDTKHWLSGSHVEVL